MNQKQKNKIILILGGLSAMGPFSIDMYLPGFPAIAADLNTDISHVALSLTSYFIGISAGQLIYGPLIDRFGRKKPLLTGLVLYILAAIGCAFSPNIYGLIGLRLMLALGGCVGMVAGRAVVRDLFPVNESAKVFSMLMLVMGVAPIIAPTIGGIVTAALGWRYIFLILALIAILMAYAVFKFLPESKGADPGISLRLKSIISKYADVVKEPSFLPYAIGGGAASAGLFAYISGAPFVFMNLFGLSPQHFGWIFAANAMGLISGSQVNRHFLQKYGSLKVVQMMIIALFGIGTILALTSILHIAGFFVIFPLVFSYLFCLGFLNPNTTSLAMESFSKNAGSASALLGSIQMLAGAAASGLVSRFHNGTTLPMTFVMAGCATIGIVLLLSYISIKLPAFSHKNG